MMVWVAGSCSGSCSRLFYALVLPVASKELLLVEVEQEARWCMHRLKYK